MEEQRYPRYSRIPYRYKLVHFVELHSMIIDENDRCTCTELSYCPLGKEKNQDRCTLEELRKCDEEAVVRRGIQSGD